MEAMTNNYTYRILNSRIFGKRAELFSVASAHSSTLRGEVVHVVLEIDVRGEFETLA